MIRPEFIKTVPADVERIGVEAAYVLALVRYVTSFEGEYNGRRFIDGEMWWQASYADIGEAIGLSAETVRRILTRHLVPKGELLSQNPKSSAGDQTKAYRIPSDQPIGQMATPVSSQSAKWPGGMAKWPHAGQGLKAPTDQPIGQMAIAPDQPKHSDQPIGQLADSGDGQMADSSITREDEDLSNEEGGEDAAAITAEIVIEDRDPSACPTHGLNDPGISCIGCMVARKWREAHPMTADERLDVKLAAINAKYSNGGFNPDSAVDQKAFGWLSMKDDVSPVDQKALER